LLESLRLELKQAASRISSNGTGKLDPKQLVFSIPGSGETGFDAHAVYAGDNAMSGSAPLRNSGFATEGVRNTLAAILTRFNFTAAASVLHMDSN